MLSKDTPIAALAGIGPTYATKLQKLHIFTVGDLIEHYPFRYENYASIKSIAETKIGEEVTIIGTLWEIKNAYTRNYRIKTITKALIHDGSGTIEAVWFNQSYLTKNLQAGMEVSLSGKLKQNGYKLQLVSPAYEILKSNRETVNTGRIVPIYPETEGVTSRWLRTKIAQLLPQINQDVTDWLPRQIIEKADLLPLDDALQKIHFPNAKDDIIQSRKRIAIDELLKVHLTALKRKQEWEGKSHGHAFVIDQKKVQDFIARLPFTLTKAQYRVIDEILADLKNDTAMNRLLEGDVGSGKTVVAAVAMYIAFLNGRQSAIMAPTAILAQQHFQTLSSLLEPLGLKVALLTGGKQPKASGDQKLQASSFKLQGMDIVVGTHALLSESTKFKNLGFIVIDEQHKFGVEQRALLHLKGITPHVLTMTATPIPRTLALTLYGNLDLSVLDEMPVGRTKPKTFVVPQQKRQDAYNFIAKEITAKKVQAFIVCPLIELSETFNTAKAATVEYEKLSTEIFPQLQLGLLHGRMSSKQKEETMAKFRSQELDILVATPLVEVGVDIPHATIMVIEAADRFGLAQLHQLRGRVGRREGQDAFCFLFTELIGEESIKRLRSMEKIYSGLELAEVDLQYRGAGNIFGTEQHGIATFKVAKLSNLKLIEQTRKLAQQIFTDYYEKGDQEVKDTVDRFDKRLIEPN